MSNYIEFLGVGGTRTPDQGTTSLRISEHCVIDAGNLIHGLSNQLLSIEHIFLTHSHLDHIVDIPFIADLFVLKQKSPLKIYGLKETLYDLRHFIFNHRIWPNFEEINLIDQNKKTIELVEIQPNTPYPIDDIILTPFKTNHTDGSCGYIIEKNSHAIMFTSDTYRCPAIWKILDTNPHIHSLVIDVSFPTSFDQLSRDSKHLTPKVLAEEIQNAQRNDFKIYPMHLKTLFEHQIKQELEELNVLRGGHVLQNFECLPYDPDVSQPKFSERSRHSIISQINAIGSALSSEKNIDALLELIITQAKKLTHADAGTLYLFNPKSNQLEFNVIQNDTLNINIQHVTDFKRWPPLRLYNDDGTPNMQMAAVVCAITGKTINITNVYKSILYDFSGTIAFDHQTGYSSESMLVIPLKDHEDQLIGILQLINKKEMDNTNIPFTELDEEIALSMGSQAAVSLTKQRLINDLELLLESFLKTINVAIEEKSPYTAGHIDRMVQLSLTIAHAINHDTTFFPEVTYTPDQLKEIKFAALMHDIGKITTPENIMDKSTKLETIFDRIDLIRLRFELLKHEANTKCLLQTQSDPQNQDVYEQQYKHQLSQLENDFAFLIDANKGKEYFSNEECDRIHHIARYTVTIDGKSEPLLTENEVNNLIVQKGTLTSDQRQIINNHAAVSLRMLKPLPFPRKFERVAEIACGHHEKINGKGYPLGLKGDELSLEARILAIADIFEALSASDRPYKKAKKLSEVMKILFFMVQDNDLDRDIFRFFYESGLYLTYAKTILKEEYIDTVTLDFTTKGNSSDEEQ